MLLTDTVGFIRKLPHHLVKAFKSTLDEVRYADVLLIVADAADSEVEQQLKVTEDVISELGGADKPRIYVYNKIDKIENFDSSVTAENAVSVSGKTGAGIDRLLELIVEAIRKTKKEVTLLFPYTEQSRVSGLYNEYTVLSTEYTDDGVLISAILDERGIGNYKKYILR